MTGTRLAARGKMVASASLIVGLAWGCAKDHTREGTEQGPAPVVVAPVPDPAPTVTALASAPPQRKLRPPAPDRGGGGGDTGGYDGVSGPHGVAGASAPGTISGRVVTPSGNPLPEFLEAQVHGRFADGRGHRPVRVRDDGTFVAEGLLEGAVYEIRVFAFHGSRVVSARGVVSGTGDIALAPRLNDWTRGTIRGTVMEPTGEPAGPGIVVWAIRTQRGWCGTIGEGESSATRTLSDGSFLLEYLGFGDFTISACREGPQDGKKPRTVEETAAACLIPEGSTEVVLRLGPPPRPTRFSPEPLAPSPHELAASAITGRLLTRDGWNLPEYFLLELVPEAGGKSRTIHPSPSGLFDSGTLAEGNWHLRAASPSGLVVGEKKGVAAGSRDVEIPLDACGTIGGRVFGIDGTAAGPGFVVDAAAIDPADERRPGGRSTALTREDGSFLLEYLGNFTFTVKTFPHRRMPMGREDWVPGPAPAGIPTGSVGLALHLVPRVQVSGTLLSAEGEPIDATYVRARQDWRDSGDSDQTDREGRFHIDCLAAGKFRALVTVGKNEIDLGEHDAPAEGLVLRLPR